MTSDDRADPSDAQTLAVRPGAETQDLPDELDGPDPRTRPVVGPYLLDGVLGTGGMGVVRRATDAHGQPLAVKILSGAVSEPLVQRFERESRIRIQHPNVAQVLDAGVDGDGTRYIALELLEGESLYQRLKHRRLEADEAVNIGVQACQGLIAAHDKGIVHRDLKPGNIFCCTDGTIKLLDFGIARLAGEADHLTRTGEVIGTTYYLSPEQARGEAHVDHQTDIWALGAVLYRGLAGEPPFRRDSALTSMLAAMMEKLVPLTKVATDVPVELAAVIERALIKSKTDRWESARAFAGALKTADLSRLRMRGETAGSFSIAPGESRVVAVLLAERVQDDDRVAAAIREAGGGYVPLRGTRTLGLFGSDAWEGDEIARAVSAALAARDAAGVLAVASGRVAQSGAGVSGAAVTQAEAACSLGIEGVLVSAESAKLIPETYELRRVGDDVFEVHGDPSNQVARSSTRERALEWTLGRSVEIAQLRQALEIVKGENSALAVLVSGPAGIGKSRLRREMQRLARQLFDDGELVQLVGKGTPHGKNVALSLFASALERRAAKLGEEQTKAEDALPERQQAIRALAEEAVKELPDSEDVPGFLGQLLGVRMPRSSAVDAALTDARLMADRLRLVLHDYFEGLTRQGPVLLLLEDLQWADEASLDMIDELLDRLRDEQLLVFVTARPEFVEEHPDRLSARDVINIAPRGLVSSDVSELAKQITGKTLPAPVIRRITEKTMGNPLFVEQILLALVDRDLLDALPDELPIPVTVEAAVQTRLDHLPREEKELCKRASVLDGAFSIDELSALGALDPKPLLRSLARRDLIASRSRRRRDGSREYAFRSLLVREIAYRTLTDPSRLHRRAAQFLRRSANASSEEIAHHYERAGLREWAARRYAAATFAAWRRGDSRGALRCSDLSIGLGAPRHARFLLHMARSEAFGFLGRRDEQGQELEAASETARTSAQQASALAERAWWLMRIGRTEDALGTSELAVTAARRSSDTNVLVRALGRRMAALRYAGRLEEAKVAYEEAERRAKEASTQLRAMVAGWRAQLKSALGDLGERRRAFQSAALLYQKSGDVRRAAAVEVNLADVYNQFGAYAEAVAANRNAIAASRRVGHRTTEGYATCNLGYSLTMLGRNEEAQASFEQAERIAAETKEQRLHTNNRVYWALAKLLAGREAEAAQMSEAAIRAATELSLPDVKITACVIGSRARLQLGDDDRSLAHAEEGVRLYAELGAVEEFGVELHLAHANVLLALGREAEADAQLQAGRRLLESMALGVSDPEWRRRLLEDPPAHRAIRDPSGA